MSSIYSILSLLGKRIEASILSNYSMLEYITEIRIRLNKPLVVYIKNEPKFVHINEGYISAFQDGCIITEKEEFGRIIDNLCNNSFHTNIETLVKGYIITKSGIRIGASSKAVYTNGELTSVKDIASLNIRIPREHKNCSRQILNQIYENSLPSIIVAAAPSMGKTTFLRDYSRLISSGYKGSYNKVCIIDERCELAAGFDVGINTDVISNFSKDKGIEMAIRTMSPDLIVCDEIGTPEELEKIKFGFSSGVKFAVSVHTSSVDAISSDSILYHLISTNFFDYLILLEHYTESYKIFSIKEEALENSRNFNDNDLLDFYGNFIDKL